MKRRTLLTAGGTALAGSLVAGATAVRSVANSADRSLSRAENAVNHDRAVERLMEGTEQETGVFAVDGAEDGPTAVVIGGIHGNEVNGYRAAADATNWEIDAGRLLVVPLADIVAIERNVREGPDGNLNRLFPAGRPPESDLARAIWRVVEEADPDVVLDLHRSRGLLEPHYRWVGQAVFPTGAPGALEDAEYAIDYMNDHYVPRTMRFHRFSMGSVQDDGRDNGLLIQKVHHDLGVAGFLIESTEFLLDLDTQIRWTGAMAELLLERNGIRRTA